MASDAGEECSICSDTESLMVHLSSCGHSFCVGCLRRWSVFGAQVIPDDELGARLSTKDPTCPACRAKYNFEICFAERETQTAVLKVPQSKSRLRLGLDCPRCRRQFSTELVRGRATCPFCNCSQAVVRGFEIKCPECDSELKSTKLFDHLMQCVKVPCPACQTEFADFASHVRTACTKVPVLCCGFTGTFSQVKEHVQGRPFSCGLGMLGY
jgi:hypothetical protein